MSEKNTQEIPRFKQQSIFTMILKGVFVLAVVYFLLAFFKPDLIPAGMRIF